MSEKMRVEQKSWTKSSIIRLFFFVILIVVQFWWIIFLITNLESKMPWLSTVITFGAMLLAFTIAARHLNSAYRMFWIMIVLSFPIVGIVLYVAMGRKNSTRRMRKEFENIDHILFRKMQQDPDTQKALEAEDQRSAGASNYLWKTCGFPVYQNTETEFFPDAAEAFERQLQDLQNAKHHIFMEYFAIEEQGAFDRVFQILKEKAANGVEVRMIYDDIGSISFLNRKFNLKMEEAGIHCVRFNPVLPFLNIFVNNRDHRKIMVIDGEIAYTGGYNMANEYFHITEPYGYWKDTGVRLRGAAIHSFSLMFLEMWDLISRSSLETDLEKYLPAYPYNVKSDGYVQPYADSPLDNEPTGEEVYMNMLRTAKKYAYFVTPYLLITDEMRREMVGAAKRGVDVRIITPGIPDKKMVYQETRSYYAGLVRGGVRIYEYTPGFCHAKMSIVDDRSATVGTINLDYRSLYLHFEDGVLFHRCSIIPEIRADFEKMFSQSEEVTNRYSKGAQNILQRAVRAFLRFVAPLL
ncbi:MAG: cardiolipin synthase [Eubacterium sp.]|nr:cardiolipin synthase [Eubacterium sp.]